MWCIDMRRLHAHIALDTTTSASRRSPVLLAATNGHGEHLASPGSCAASRLSCGVHTMICLLFTLRVPLAGCQQVFVNALCETYVGLALHARLEERVSMLYVSCVCCHASL